MKLLTAYLAWLQFAEADETIYQELNEVDEKNFKKCPGSCRDLHHPGPNTEEEEGENGVHFKL